MKSFLFLVFTVVAAHFVHAQDTVFVYSNFEKISNISMKEVASYYTITPTPDLPLQGKVNFYDRKGKLGATIEYNSSGKKHGLSTFYHEEGGKEKEQAYLEGEIHGPYKKWYRNGQINEEGLAITQTKTDAQTNLVTFQSLEYLLYQYWDSLGTHLLKGGNGELALFHKNGSLQSKGNYSDGRKTGIWSGYYDDGKQYYEEEYLQGKLLQGRSYKNDKVYVYTKIEEEAQPISGMKAFYDFIAENIKYPRKAFKESKQGIVYVRFVIDEVGNVEHTEVVRGVTPEMDEEAMRVIRLTRWRPGLQRGIAVKQRKILPLKFSLSR